MGLRPRLPSARPLPHRIGVNEATIALCVEWRPHQHWTVRHQVVDFVL